MWKQKILDYGKMIKFSHTVFALPFALSAVVLAWQTHVPSLWELFLILVAMVGARSAAMGFNRIVDADIDKKNPRTAVREIPSGVLTRSQALIFVGVSSLLFVGAAALLSPLCFGLSFPLLGLLFFYSFTKRFTALCHLVLGFVISLAPVGAWVALTGTLNWGIVMLAAALWLYIAGFDILYACQDIDFDREQGLFSLPVLVGPVRAMQISTLFHVLFLVFLLGLFLAFDMHAVFLVFWAMIAVLIVLEHRLVKPDDLSRIDMAFFHVNSAVSVILFAGILIETFF
ncbi:MAG: putative 4-hydroxybenzoate polyprenyltransferase [Desulfotignum sp.]|nr:putative 4-hydroxybenzoate polyprenyltransferase [Desulfotignum sp.]MCF8087820.1 putative 4-hydroxybenzoate polyprenyltransferase [Desulfotignum sp.]MCF8137808.1 putative 4-hydroxybenzoate polyprenyltransferase [Desulfotignum sp.]